ncbi:Biofilm-associated protein [Winogradskyella psychrotolerans RS-3]|uniref:Biofilm-associated protein n=1 Tax=Winogradskyella psychrotolerans RS-3 TaxID=641526 RepID=S7WV29_9FLAO|nr:Biofilm-associated protein [Winogradskyella psychrotolerans RS-3]
MLYRLASRDYTIGTNTRAEVDHNANNISDFTIHNSNIGTNFTATSKVDDPPMAECVTTLTVQLDPTGNAIITAADIDNGSSDDLDTLAIGTDIIIDIATFNCSNIGTPVTVTLSATDSLGQTDTCTATVIVEDNIQPVPDAAALTDVTAECEVISLASPTATDNCGGTVTVTNDATLPITSQGTTVVTWTYDDGNGNTSTQTQNVVINDITAPAPDAAALADITSECIVTSLTTPTATDNCGGTVTVTNDATLPITAQGTTVVTWTYDDGDGNISTQIQNIVINNITAPDPDATTLADITSECEVSSLTAPTATDNCSGLVTVTNDATLPITAQGTTVVTWTYTDVIGNTSTQTQNVIIDDNTAPVTDLAILADVTDQCEVNSLTAPTATDNCGGTVTVTNDATLPITAQGTTVVTWTYTDVNSNTSTQTQNVFITDTTAPVPDAATLTDVTDQCVVTSLTAPTATDNCGGTVTVTNDATLPISAQGTTVVTWTYTNVNSNTSTQTQNVVITDTTAPIPDAATLTDVTHQCEVTSLTAPTATDNCGGTVTTTHDATLPITTQGTTIVTWTYDDGNGNTSTQTQNVIITDNTAPILTAAPSDITVVCVTNAPAMISLAWTDNCDAGGNITGVDSISVGGTCGGTITRTWNITDSSGNAAITRTQIITINDNVAPSLAVAPADVTVNCFLTFPLWPT